MKRDREDESAAAAPPAAPPEPPLPEEEPPPDATALEAAQFWYYEGEGAMMQGPFSSAHMRAWFRKHVACPTGCGCRCNVHFEDAAEP